MYPAPVMVAWETFTAAVPVFVIVMLWILLFPTETFPKLTLLELAESTPVLVPGVPPVPPLVRPTQLESPMVARIVTNAKRDAMGPRLERRADGVGRPTAPIEVGARVL